MADRSRWLRRIAELDPSADATEIYRITSQHEMPWDVFQALGLALFRTYAVPSIGALLATTGQFTEDTQKRYDDTALLMDAIVEHGFDQATGLAAVRRINQMHRMHGIEVDDLRYVLATFVVVPVRWAAAHAWRPMSPAEVTAGTNHYRTLGRHMGITDVPETYADFERLLDSYEAAHFAYSEGGRAVADATLDLLGTLPPFGRLPAWLTRRVSYALMDPPLLDALRYPRPTRAERALVAAGLQLRAVVERRLPPRAQPVTTIDRPNIRSYPTGFRVEELGTFACPGSPADWPRRGAHEG